MAAITFTALYSGTTYRVTGTAQADTGQTQWVLRPKWAKYLWCYLDLTALAGTTRVLTPSFLTTDPYTLTDTNVVNIAEHGALTGITAVNQYMYELGPGITGIADDVTQSASADSRVAINCILPPVIGFKLLLDRGDADETYTYTFVAEFRP